MHLILYGPEGSGKGTQAKLLAEKYHLPIYTSGDLVRETAKNNQGLLGEICRAALTSGVYVSDKEMFSLWEDKLKSVAARNGFVLDGFPRTLPQAKFLKRQVKSNNYQIDAFILLNLSDEEAKKRLSLRSRKLFEGSTINHDEPVRVAKRLKEFRKHEKDLLKFYGENKLLLTINGEQNVEEVFKEIKAKLP